MGEMRNVQQIRASEVRVLALSMLAFWGIAVVVWWSALWHADLYATFEAQLPQLTHTFIASARAGAPFIVATLLSGAAIHLIWRPGPSPLVRAAWLLCIALAGAALAMVALTLPIANLCGDFVPPERKLEAGSTATDRSDPCPP